MTATTELQKVPAAKIEQTAEQFLKDQAMMEEMLQQLADYRKRNETLQAEVDRLNKVALENSVAFQDRKKHLNAVVVERNILKEYLRTWLQTFESKFDSDEAQEVTEASDYLTHAVWMREHCGREDYGFIRRVQEWYDNQPAWKQKPATL